MQSSLYEHLKSLNGKKKNVTMNVMSSGYVIADMYSQTVGVSAVKSLPGVVYLTATWC